MGNESFSYCLSCYTNKNKQTCSRDGRDCSVDKDLAAQASVPQCPRTWLAWQCVSVMSAAGRDNWRQEDSWGLPSSQNYQSVAPVLGRDSVSGNKGWLCMDIQPSYLCEHLHTYVHTHMSMCTCICHTHKQSKETKKEKGFKMLSIILFVR